MSAVPNLPEDMPLIATNGAMQGVPNPTASPASSFKLHDTPIENFRPLKVIVIGAGYSGIYCGIRIPERLRNVELVIYEKNEGVGGTWWENRYTLARLFAAIMSLGEKSPQTRLTVQFRYLGCACDVPGQCSCKLECLGLT
jgi:hypothetical protein